MIYKEGTKQILKRVLNISYRPSSTKVKDPPLGKLKDNNTSNNTENNTTNISLAPANKFAADSFEYLVCKDFLDAHIERNSMSVEILLRDKTQNEVLQEWADEIRKFLQLDNYQETEIKYLLQFTYTKEMWLRYDDYNFWQKNMQSIMKLRKKNKHNMRYFEVFIEKFRENKPAINAYLGITEKDLFDK